jgi:hypothetical protein
MGMITIDDFKANTKEWLIDKLYDMIYEDSVRDTMINICNLRDELHKSKYPSTFEECCKVLRYTPGNQYDTKSIKNFQKLRICRDAYWKIAGEQMGLREPWRPNWLDEDTLKFVIVCSDRNNILCSQFVERETFLAFPTEEMRDIFYENFKDLIEECKNFL